MSRCLGAKGHRTVWTRFSTPRLGVIGCMSAGAHRGHHPRVDLMGAGSQAARCEHKPLLRPVVGLTENLPRNDLKHITIEAIRAHRRLRDEADALYAPYLETPPSKGDTVGSARLAWVSAMVRMHAQQALLSTLLEVLGYVPDVPDERETEQRTRSA